MEHVEQCRLLKDVSLHLVVNLGLHIMEPTCVLVRLMRKITRFGMARKVTVKVRYFTDLVCIFNVQIIVGDFKSPLGLAFQLKETFTDRVGACVIDNSPSSLNVETPTASTSNVETPTASTSNVETPTASASTTEIHLPTQGDNKLPTSPDCRGRTVVVGEGCIDLIYIVDCSKSVGEENFHNSLDFVGRSAALFNINNDTTKNDTARVALVTYDHKVHPIFNLGEKATLVETINAINKTKFCGGATAVRKVLEFVREKVIPISRPQCKRAIFLFSDGVNNWAGDPIKEAKELKEQKGVEIYTIAFGVGEDIRVDSKALETLASNPDYYFKVQDASAIRDALKKAFTTKVGKILRDILFGEIVFHSACFRLLQNLWKSCRSKM